MCFPFDAVPPIAPIAGAAVDSEDLVLTSKDGTQFSAFVARGAAGGPGIVILPDIRGLYRFYEELALRFAERGITAVAFDFFGRTAGLGKRGEDFEWREHVMATKADKITEDVAASAAYLRSAAGGNCSSVFTVGFCFGGSNSWLQATADHGLKGAIGFYGRPGPSFADQSPGPLTRVNDFKAPLLLLMGGADAGIPVADINEFTAALDAAKKPYECKIYDGAPHSFFDRAYEQFANESADAWDKCLAFIEKNK